MASGLFTCFPLPHTEHPGNSVGSNSLGGKDGAKVGNSVRAGGLVVGK